MTIAPVSLIAVFQLRIKCLVSECHNFDCSIHFTEEHLAAGRHDIEPDFFEAEIPSICEVFLRQIHHIVV